MSHITSAKLSYSALFENIKDEDQYHVDLTKSLLSDWGIVHCIWRSKFYRFPWVVSFKELVEETFRIRKAPKSLVAAAKKCSSRCSLRWSQTLLRWNYPLEKVVEVLSMHQIIEFDDDILSMLKDFPKETVLRLLKNDDEMGEDSLNMYAKDAAHCYEELSLIDHPNPFEGMPRVRGWEQIHHWLYMRQIELDEDFDLPIGNGWEVLDGATNGTYTLVLPKSTKDLKEWGKTLNHCVGSYGRRISGGHCVIIGVMVEGVMTYTIEIIPSDGELVINQFMGYGNNPAPDEIQDEVCNLMGGIN